MAFDNYLGRIAELAEASPVFDDEGSLPGILGVSFTGNIGTGAGTLQVVGVFINQALYGGSLDSTHVAALNADKDNLRDLFWGDLVAEGNAALGL